MKQADPEVKIVEVFTDCIGYPVRLVCFLGGPFADTVDVMVCDDDTPLDDARYLLHVSCREAHMDGIANLHGFHCRTDAKGRRIPFAKEGDTLCIQNERCPLRLLTGEELLFPFLVDELTTDQTTVPAHWHN